MTPNSSHRPAFFASGSSQDDEDEEGYEEKKLDTSAAMTRNYDSILDVMGALLPPPIGTKRLLWHYRSKDERLIAFSNSQPGLYDWSLTTFPGSRSDEVVTHELVPFVPGRVGQEDSVSDEVEAVVRAVAAHARKHPNESLGVITMCDQAQEPGRREPAPGPPRGPRARRLHGPAVRPEREVLREEPRAGPRR